ncbi:MAG: putative methylase [Blastocatellia bacterium]|jgi:putative DNA methylase|nr:putative methylase [Blastocatellia bacterium]
MSIAAEHAPPVIESTAIECDFPAVEISQVAEQESWRKEINRPIYHIHKWWATRLGTVFRAIALAALHPAGKNTWEEFYKRHRLSGKIILDPFMGSGTTLGEALKLGTKAIGCDINPISTFLVRQAFTPVSESQLRAAFNALESSVAPEIRRYYQTRDPGSGNLIPVLYFFWVKTVETPAGETVPLFSRYVFSQDAYPKKKPRAHIVCAHCWGIFADRYDATDIACPLCLKRFNPQQGPASGQYVTTNDGSRYRIKDLLPTDGEPLPHRMYALLALRPDGEKVYLPASDEDLALFTEASARLQTEQLSLPTLAVRAGHNTNQARGYNYKHWRDFFNSRQLLCLGLLLRGILEIKDEVIQEQMLCLFSSTLEFNNLFCSFKGEGTGAVRHMFSHHILKPERAPLENSVWGTEKSSGTFSTLFESRLLPAKLYLDQPFEVALETDLVGRRRATRRIVASDPIRPKLVETWEQLSKTDGGLMILNGDSSRLPLPDLSVDAVITDPPYFDFVHYSELSDFFFAWLSPLLKVRYPSFDRVDSSAKGEVQHKEPRVFANQLVAVFSECCRVLKQNGVLAFSFHHSRAEGWAAISEAVTRSGLEIVSAHPVHAELRAASPKSAAKDPISLDAILVCRKRRLAAPSVFHQGRVIERSKAIVTNLQGGGMSLSAADQFVIVASQTLVALSRAGAEFELVCETILETSRAAQDAGADSSPLVEPNFEYAVQP